MQQHPLAALFGSGHTPQFAPVVGVGMAREMINRRSFGNYHLLLAHDTLKRPAEYGHIYQTIRLRHPHTFIIMDNSIIEEGVPRTPKELALAAKTVIADCVVLPDMIDDAHKTVQMAEEFAPELREYLVEYSPWTKLLGVCQGRTEDEVFECAKQLLSIEHVNFLAVPRGLTKNLKSRVRITQRIGTLGAPIHLLGFSDDFHDDLTAATSSPAVMGIDSAVPIRWGLDGKVLACDGTVSPRRPDWLEIDAQWTPQVGANLQWVRHFLSTGNPVSPDQLDDINFRSRK